MTWQCAMLEVVSFGVLSEGRGLEKEEKKVDNSQLYKINERTKLLCFK